MVQGHLLPLLPEIMCVTSQAMSSHGLPNFAHLSAVEEGWDRGQNSILLLEGTEETSSHLCGYSGLPSPGRVGKGQWGIKSCQRKLVGGYQA